MNMKEKVANAILNRMDLTDGLDVVAATEYAKAAIEAMKEPTEEMVINGTEARKLYPNSICAIWQSMLETALNS